MRDHWPSSLTLLRCYLRRAAGHILISLSQVSVLWWLNHHVVLTCLRHLSPRMTFLSSLCPCPDHHAVIANSLTLRNAVHVQLLWSYRLRRLLKCQRLLPHCLPHPANVTSDVCRHEAFQAGFLTAKILRFQIILYPSAALHLKMHVSCSIPRFGSLPVAHIRSRGRWTMSNFSWGTCWSTTLVTKIQTCVDQSILSHHLPTQSPFSLIGLTRAPRPQTGRQRGNVNPFFRFRGDRPQIDPSCISHIYAVVNVLPPCRQCPFQLRPVAHPISLSLPNETRGYLGRRCWENGTWSIFGKVLDKLLRTLLRNKQGWIPPKISTGDSSIWTYCRTSLNRCIFPILEVSLPVDTRCIDYRDPCTCKVFANICVVWDNKHSAHSFNCKLRLACCKPT